MLPVLLFPIQTECPFHVTFRRGAAVVARFAMKRALKLTKARKFRASEAFSGSLAFDTALTLASAGPTPRSDNT